MAKTTSAKEYRKKNNGELLNELKKLREDLQKIRFTKGTGPAVAKLTKIKEETKENNNNIKEVKNENIY